MYKKFIEEIKKSASEKNISIKEIADKLGMYPTNITRALSGNHSTGIKTLCDIADVIGIKITIK